MLNAAGIFHTRHGLIQLPMDICDYYFAIYSYIQLPVAACSTIRQAQAATDIREKLSISYIQTEKVNP